MATTDSDTEKHSYRFQDTILLGIDERDRHHVWLAEPNKVYVIDGSQRVHVEQLGRFEPEQWMAHVRDRVGFADERYGQGLAEMLAEALDA